MRNIRIIGRLDVKSAHLVKGIQLEGLRKLGDPNTFAKSYYDQGIDEIIYMDIVASLYQRNSLLDIVEAASDGIFIPLTVGGGVRSVEDARAALHSGADKVAINTAAIKNPELISSIAKEFGSQCMVVSVEAKRKEDGVWEVYYDNGREKTGMRVLEWVKEVEDRGAGEILITSVDCEGVGKGMDISLISNVCNLVQVPVIASGGIGCLDDVVQVVRESNISGLAVAKVLHYGDFTVADIKNSIRGIEGIEIR